MSWASPVTAFLSARQRPEGFSSDVTLETPDDVALRFALRQAALQVERQARPPSESEVQLAASARQTLRSLMLRTWRRGRVATTTASEA